MTDRNPLNLARELVDAAKRATPAPWNFGTPGPEEAQSTAEWLAGCAVDPDAPAASRVWSAWTTDDQRGLIVPAVTGDGPRSEGNAAFIALARNAGPDLAHVVLAVAALEDQLREAAHESYREGMDDAGDAYQAAANLAHAALNGETND